MRKVLFVATVDSHISNFHIPYLKLFHDYKYEIHVASRGTTNIKYADKKYDISFERSPHKFGNLKSLKQLKEIINNTDFDLIHCHTPMGGVLARIASIKVRKKNTKVFYTAHGFHFYDGAAIKNWLLYYPIEKLLSKHTDCLITINQEDYNHAITKKFKSKSVSLVNGVGIDLNKFKRFSKEVNSETRRKLGYSEDDFLLIYVAELTHRKHQDMLINVIDLLKDRIPNLKLLIVGEGILKNTYMRLSQKLDLNKYIRFLGYRNDVPYLMNISNLAVSSSKQEGLPVNVMEAMAIGLPLVVTNCRGNSDLVTNNVNGYVVNINDNEKFADCIEKIYLSRELSESFGRENVELVKQYSITEVIKEMNAIYKEWIR